MTASIELIAAAAANGVIGGDNRMLWHIPEDFRFFKTTTMGSPVVMGRRTWTSIGRVLPGRLNVVITRRPLTVPAGVLVAHSLPEALSLARSRAEGKGGSGRVFVSGGGVIYRQAIGLADRIWLTRIEADFEGDARFPTIPRGRFRAHPIRTLMPAPKRPWIVRFERWERRNA